MKSCLRRCRPLGGGVQRDVGKRTVGVLAEGRDRADADHDDQGQHDGIFDRGRTVLTFHEPNHRCTPISHDLSPFISVSRPRSGLYPIRIPQTSLLEADWRSRNARNQTSLRQLGDPPRRTHSFASPLHSGFAIIEDHRGVSATAGCCIVCREHCVTRSTTKPRLHNRNSQIKR